MKYTIFTILAAFLTGFSSPVHAQWLYSIDFSAHNDRNFDPYGAPGLDGGYAVAGGMQGGFTALKHIPQIKGNLGIHVSGYFVRERYRRTRLPGIPTMRTLEVIQIGPEYMYFFGKTAQEAKWAVGTKILFNLDRNGLPPNAMNRIKRSYWTGYELLLDATRFINVAEHGRIGLTAYTSFAKEDNYSDDKLRNGRQILTAGLRLKFFILP